MNSMGRIAKGPASVKRAVCLKTGQNRRLPGVTTRSRLRGNEPVAAARGAAHYGGIVGHWRFQSCKKSLLGTFAMTFASYRSLLERYHALSKRYVPKTLFSGYNFAEVFLRPIEIPRLPPRLESSLSRTDICWPASRTFRGLGQAFAGPVALSIPTARVGIILIL